MVLIVGLAILFILILKLYFLNQLYLKLFSGKIVNKIYE
jgi:hypothetical protein